MTNHDLLITLAALAGIGVLALIVSARRKARQAARAAHHAARRVSLFGRVLVTAAVITGIQFLIIRQAHNVTVLLVALALPALIAAIPLVRALTVSTVGTGRTHDKRRGGAW
ncbi:MAG TPA: hypothetical protein VHX38_13600 [Pseudonocardiaceae bacterium]|jgi:hypothetical protein|nr:hypothetical protein [Pseudonocardiaceae bacterium]